MARPPKDPSSVSSVTAAARITPGEDAALRLLLAQRARDLAAANLPPDDTFTGWLRSIIRREARAVGISVDSGPPPVRLETPAGSTVAPSAPELAERLSAPPEDASAVTSSPTSPSTPSPTSPSTPAGEGAPLDRRYLERLITESCEAIRSAGPGERQSAVTRSAFGALRAARNAGDVEAVKARLLAAVPGDWPEDTRHGAGRAIESAVREIMAPSDTRTPLDRARAFVADHTYDLPKRERDRGLAAEGWITSVMSGANVGRDVAIEALSEVRSIRLTVRARGAKGAAS